MTKAVAGDAAEHQRPAGVALRDARDHGHQQAAEESDEQRMRRRAAEQEFAANREPGALPGVQRERDRQPGEAEEQHAQQRRHALARPPDDQQAGGFMRYVDGYVLPVPKKNLQAYRRMAQKAGKIWREHGALEYRECVGDDLKVKWGVPFPRMIKAQARRDGGVLVDRVQVASASRSRQREGHEGPAPGRRWIRTSMPFDMKRMVYGGFKVLVDA